MVSPSIRGNPLQVRGIPYRELRSPREKVSQNRSRDPEDPRNHSYLVYFPIWSVSRKRRCSGAVRFGSVATTVEFDFVQLLVEALAARGFSYQVVARTTHVDAQFLVSTAVGRARYASPSAGNPRARRQWLQLSN